MGVLQDQTDFSGAEKGLKLSADKCMRVPSETVLYNESGLLALYDEGFGRCTVQKKSVDIAA